MDIKELEFLRDFTDDFDLLEKNITNFAVNLDEEIESMDTCKTIASTLQHEIQLMLKMFEAWREQVNEKYWKEWEEAYPQLRKRIKDIES